MKNNMTLDRKIVVLTPAQCELIASALEIINPDDAEIEKQARALAIQFRAEREEN
jgi:DNA-binding MarR family transcriptional regulator